MFHSLTDVQHKRLEKSQALNRSSWFKKLEIIILTLKTYYVQANDYLEKFMHPWWAEKWALVKWAKSGEVAGFSEKMWT